MDKKFHYLAGMFRSGNTVLAALLNQHPEIYVGPISPMCEYSWVLSNSMSNFQSSLTNPHRHRSKNIINNLFDNYYYDVEKPVIFDRDKNWANPLNLDLIKNNINLNPKIVYTVRPILECVASLINMLKKEYQNEMIQNGWIWRNYLSETDNMVDYMLRPGGEIDNLMLSFMSINDPDNDGMFHVVEYKDLVESPQKTMNDIYDFIGLDRFNNDFSNIVLEEKQNDSEVRLPEKLHEVRPNISMSSTDPKVVFSDYILTKYSNIDFWKKSEKL